MKKEELLDKYIKYNSKITFDIFKLIYQKLIDLGFATPHYVEGAFKEFSGDYPYFVMKLYADGPFFNQYNVTLIEQSEISVEDLLGYNPFSEFELPEQWYIEVGENAEIINKWKQTTEYTAKASIYKYVACKGNGYNFKSDYTDHSEITIEQFKQYVLKEPLISKPIKPFPTHWRIELNKETLPIVGVYYNKKHLSDPNCDTYTGNDALGYYVKSHNVENEYIKNGYTSCSFFDFGKPLNSYPEITLEQFKEFVMNEPVKIETISESKVEESVPEYVECFYSGTDAFIINKIYKCESFSKADALNLNSEIGIRESLPYEGGLWKFKPSTKEAFEKQNKPISIEKWSIGSYIVPLQNKLLTRDEPLIKGKPYQIIRRGPAPYIMCEKGIEINFSAHPNTEKTEGIKWFATKPEAEEFAKTLIEPVKSNGFPIEGCCTSKSSELEQYLIKTRGNSDSKMTKERATGIGWNESSYWWLLDTDKSSKRKYHLSDLNVWLDKPKQPLKQVIHCKTQEEWDFVGKKIGYTFSTKFNSNNKNTINPSACACGDRPHYESMSDQYQILSFQEWCDLKGYKMESKCDFIVGRWYKSTAKENNRGGDTYYGKFLRYDNGRFTATWHSVTNNFTEEEYTFSNGYKWELMTDLSEIQQYLPDGHPDLFIVNKKVKYVSETFTIRVTSREVKRINI